MNPQLKILLDMGPLAAFFVLYRVYGLLPATGGLMVCTVASLIVTYWLEKKIAVMPLVSGLVIAVFGSLTLWLQDEFFIKIKPTLVNLLFASLLLGGVWLKKNPMYYALGSALSLQEEGWRKLSLRWGVFFLFLAGLNEYVWRHFSTDFWVSFKVFGMFSLTLLFSLLQLPLIKKYQQD